MGIKHSFQILIVLISLISCENITYFNQEDFIKKTSLEEIKLSLRKDDLRNLTSSVSSNLFTPVAIDDGTQILKKKQGQIRIRGNSSRYKPKKSYTIEVKQNQKSEPIRFALDAGGDSWFTYSLILYLSHSLGNEAPTMTPLHLQINKKNYGYYNIVELYRGKELNRSQRYNDFQGELYKVDFERPANNGDVHSDTEKKFPKDQDYWSFDNLFVKAETLNSTEWVKWIETPNNADLYGIADYMVVRDFFGISDLVRVNYYLYFYSKGFTMLPWDSDNSISYSAIGGDNPIAKRMMESPVFRKIYIEKMEDYFLDGDQSNINLITLSQDYIIQLKAKLDEISYIDPYYSHKEFLDEYNKLINFLEKRPNDVKEKLRKYPEYNND